jgi:hypothetical protein
MFRKFFKEEIARETNRLDLNFIGSLHPDKKRTETGFAKLIYGNREDLGKLLGTIALNVAADDQAIYELIQNADDCKSTFFSVSYNEKYLLCINNGNYFSDNDMSAIINVAGNFKEGEDIGTFGIGFKILHRLVGIDDGRDAIINNYAGPIVFSWNKPSQFERFINGEPIGISGLGKGKENYDYERDKENPWLVKILYTCFPSNYKEPIRLGDYETRETKFDENELLEMRAFLEKVLEDTNIEGEGRRQLQNGSIFFLKLGEGKSKFLDDGIEKIKSGLSYSFKFLNRLKKIYINGEEIQEQKVDCFSEEYKINSLEFEKVNPKNKKRSIKFTFAFYKNYQKAENLRGGLVPNLYTFFSMDEEKNGLNFLLHCNAFDMNNDRRKLQANSQINENLLPIIAHEITQYIDKQKEENRGLFLSLYANLLLSNEPKSKPHISKYFFKYLNEYLHQNIPTQKGYSDNPANVKIKSTLLPIQPSDFGCPEIEWFAWQNEKFDKTLIDEARDSEKLYLDKWDIIDLFQYAIKREQIDKINAWVQKIEFETAQILSEEYKLKNNNHSQEIEWKPRPYLTLLSEIDKVSASGFNTISQIKLFKFSDGNYYSLNEIFANTNVVLIYDKTAVVKRELRYLGLIVSDLNISYKKKNTEIFQYPNLVKLILPKISEENLFKAIAEKCKQNNLNASQKHNLFFTIADFDRVGPEKLKDLELFKDMQGNIRPLRTLLKGDLQVPNWLSSYKIHKTEYVPELDKYLIKENEIYHSIIYKNWDFLIGLNINIKEFYTQVTDYYKQNTENPKLERLACIYTNEGFKKPEQVFFNTNLNSRNLEDLHNAVFKITGKPTPNKQIFSFLTDDNSPFKISRNEGISSFISANHTLSYGETLAILEFAKQNNEKLFSVAYIQKQNDNFLLVKHSHSVFQYYSNHQEINELLSNHPNFKFLPREFKANDFRDLEILQDKGLYLKVLQILDFSENLLPIVRESDKEVQLAYLEKLKNFSLQEGKTYDRNSFEHRCLKLAIDCYESNFQTLFAPKILINGKLRIKDIAVKDDIDFESITLSLSSVLTDYKGVSDIITKIINQFTDFAKSELSEKVFSIRNKRKDEIYAELLTKFPTLQNIEQFAFLLYHSRQVGKNYFTSQSLSALSSNDILQFAYKQKFTDLATYVNVGLQDKIYPSELALKNEQLPTWVLAWLESSEKQEKLNFLSALGVYTENSNICAIRKIFQTGQIIDFQGKVFAIPQNSILLVYTLKWLQNSTFKASDNAKLDALKQIYTRINYTQEIPLLYISQISESETFYSLEVSNATKYYIDVPQKEYSQKIFSVLQSKGFKLIALDFLPNQWKTSILGLNKVQTTSTLDIVILKNNSVEWEDSAYKQWKTNLKYKVALYKGEKLPYKVMFLENKIDTFEEGTSIEREGFIYFCQSVLHDIRNQLAKFINADELIKLYQLDNNIIQSLQERNTELENRIISLEEQLKKKNSATIGAEFSSDISKNDQKEANREAKEIVKEKLEEEGFEFTRGIEEYSTINGVIKEGVEYPLVVKSYKYKDEPFKIGANEWLQLMKPNSMFWVHFGNRKLGCLKLYDLLRKQDKLTISFSTENLDKEDRLEKFAELLHYFGNVHFNFNSVKPSDYSVANDLNDYRFDERKTEEDLSSDDEDLL